MPPRSILIPATAAWLAILGFAILNGAFREAVLAPALGAPWARIVSGLLLMACVALAAGWFTSRRPGLGDRACLAVGGFWLALTLLFEFGFGRLQGKSWETLTAAYRFEDGDLWPLVLLVVFVAPWLSGRIARGGAQGHSR